MSLKYEPSSEPLRISVNQLIVHVHTAQAVKGTPKMLGLPPNLHPLEEGRNDYYTWQEQMLG